MRSKKRPASRGQAQSRERKIRCKAERAARYQQEAERRGIPVEQVPAVLFQEREALIQARKVTPVRVREPEWDA